LYGFMDTRKPLLDYFIEASPRTEFRR